MPICRLIYMTVAIVIAAGMAQGQQREAVLQQVEVTNAGFNIVIATARPGGATADYRAQPDPNLVYLAAGDLVYAYTGVRQDLAEDVIFTSPACSFNVERKDFSPRTPVVIYVEFPRARRRPCDIKVNSASEVAMTPAPGPNEKCRPGRLTSDAGDIPDVRPTSRNRRDWPITDIHDVLSNFESRGQLVGRHDLT